MESAKHWKIAFGIVMTGKVLPVTWSSEVEQFAWSILTQIYVRIERGFIGYCNIAFSTLIKATMLLTVYIANESKHSAAQQRL